MNGMPYQPEDDEHGDWNAETNPNPMLYLRYTKGHKDGMDNEVIYRPSIETDREKTIFKKILKQRLILLKSITKMYPSSTPELRSHRK